MPGILKDTRLYLTYPNGFYVFQRGKIIFGDESKSEDDNDFSFFVYLLHCTVDKLNCKKLGIKLHLKYIQDNQFHAHVLN